MFTHVPYDIESCRGLRVICDNPVDDGAVDALSDDRTGDVYHVHSLLSGGMSLAEIQYMRSEWNRFLGWRELTVPCHFRTMVGLVPGYTINDPSNYSLKTFPDNVQWTRVGEKDEMSVNGRRIKIYVHASLHSLTYVKSDANGGTGELVLSFSITDDDEKRGLDRARGFSVCNRLDEGALAFFTEVTCLTLSAVLGKSIFRCYTDVFAPMTDTRVDAEPARCVRNLREGDEVVVTCRGVHVPASCCGNVCFELVNLVLLWRD